MPSLPNGLSRAGEIPPSELSFCNELIEVDGEVTHVGVFGKRSNLVEGLLEIAASGQRHRDRLAAAKLFGRRHPAWDFGNFARRLNQQQIAGEFDDFPFLSLIGKQIVDRLTPARSQQRVG